MGKHERRAIVDLVVGVALSSTRSVMDTAADRMGAADAALDTAMASADPVAAVDAVLDARTYATGYLQGVADCREALGQVFGEFAMGKP